MGEKQQSIPPGGARAGRGPRLVVLSPGCPRRTLHSPSRSSTPSFRRPPTSHCDPSSSPSSRWVPWHRRQRGTWGGWLWGQGCAAHVPPQTRVSPPLVPGSLHVWSHTRPGLFAIIRGGRLSWKPFAKSPPFFFNLPFNFVLTRRCHPAPGGFAGRWHAWQHRRCRQMFKLCRLSLVSRGITKKRE